MDSIIKLENIDYTYPDEEQPVFTQLDISLPPGVTSLMGQNGTGKSTLLLLAAGRLFAQKGVVEILGKDSRELESEEERNEYVSFIYQNMEFDTEGTTEELLEFIYENGFQEDKNRKLLLDVIDVFELGESLGKPLQHVSKGEMQRAILAFSLLYGSKIIMMDEPVFALEEHQKKQAMEYMANYSRLRGVHLLYSAHEIEITEQYSDNVILFHKDGSIGIGSTKATLTDENIENAYELPRAMLYQKEHLYRDNLVELSRIRPDDKASD
ncbi:MAG: ATP-binding cassette domain-containing protein [Spirochaetales bacterium]|jgi:iron complex transport system ATP-binding protein|nr:ATP-binding cassette domain-containing protein [Spirochaetales bacterium]